MKKLNKSAVFCIVFVTSLFAKAVFARTGASIARSSPLTSVPSKPTILPLARKVKNVTALSTIDAITKGSSNMSFDSSAFAHGAQLNSNNTSMVQGASSMQAGTSAGSTTLSSDLLTGANLLTAGKMFSGASGNLVKKMQTSAIASSNISTLGSASTKITGDAGTFGNSSFSQSGTVLGATVTQGPVTGSAGTVHLSGNPYSPTS
jgi:hypothetical protein